MALFAPALWYTLQWEDPKHEYACVPDPTAADPCAESIAGVNSGAWPEWFSEIKAHPLEPGVKVAEFYETCFWNPMQVGGLENQDLANRVFDEGVNAGAQTAIRLLQEAVGMISSPLAADGILGPITREAVNALDPERLLAAYREKRAEHYEQIGGPNLTAWLKRARA